MYMYIYIYIYIYISYSSTSNRLATPLEMGNNLRLSEHCNFPSMTLT